MSPDYLCNLSVSHIKLQVPLSDSGQIYFALVVVVLLAELGVPRVINDSYPVELRKSRQSFQSDREQIGLLTESGT